MLHKSERVVWIEDGLIKRESVGSEFNIEEMGHDTLGRH